MTDFLNLQNIYKSYIDQILSQYGLTTTCVLNYGTTSKNLCPNCIYDPNLKKSSNKYKFPGPIQFEDGMICPYCNGIGFYGNETRESIKLAILWDNKKWINSSTNISNPENFIQAISHYSLIHKLKKAKDLTVILDNNLANPIYELYEDPTPAGLGDNHYLFTMWKKVGVSSRTTSPPCVSNTMNMELLCVFINNCISSINRIGLNCDIFDYCRTENADKLILLCNNVISCYSSTENIRLVCSQIQQCHSSTGSYGLDCSNISSCSSSSNEFDLLCNNINNCFSSINYNNLNNTTIACNSDEKDRVKLITNIASGCLGLIDKKHSFIID